MIMKASRMAVLGVIAAFATILAGDWAAMAQSAKKGNLSNYQRSKGNRLVLAGARALAARDCKGKIRVFATRPGKTGGHVEFKCVRGEYSVVISFKPVPGGKRLYPDRFDYPG
jgi:hypothetical protein